MCCGLQGWVECVKCAMVEGLGGMCKMCCGLQGWVECVKCAVICRAGWNVLGVLTGRAMISRATQSQLESA